MAIANGNSGGIPNDAADLSLIRLIVDHASESAFRVLYARHAPRMYRIALRMLGSIPDAEDVLQESWLRAVPRLPGFEGRAALGTWLAAIVINLSRDLLDRRGRWTMCELDLDASADPPGRSIDPLDLERALDTLSPGTRAVFVLHDIEGFTHQEIGAQLGCAAGTSKSQLFRARRALRVLLQGTPEEENRYA